MTLVEKIEQKQKNENVSNFPSFRSGDTVSVSVRIQEGEKSRVQLFQGTVIGIKARNSLHGHFRVRKISNGTGVERVFPFHSPNVVGIEVVGRGKTRKSKHYYLRDRQGKSARIKVDYDRKE